MMQPSELRGLYTALITPFKDGQVDEKAFADFCEWQIEQGVHGLVPSGTTGESPTLTHDEHKRVVEICVEAAAGRVPVMAGTGSNSTAEAIEFTQHAADVGATSALVVSPYYNKPNAEGMFQHFKAVHDSADIPLIIYNVPARSVVDIDDELMARLAELPRVIGVKDATGDLSRVSTLRARIGDRLALISGEDMTAVGFNAMGGQGCISVTANVAPALCSDVQNYSLNNDYLKALSAHEMLVDLHQAMFTETNPIPVKAAVAMTGRCLPDIKLPLIEATEATQKNLRSTMDGLSLLES